MATILRLINTICLIVFISSGLIKPFMSLYSISFPIDITLLSAVFIIITGFWTIKRNFSILSPYYIYALLILTIFYLFLIGSISYSDSPSYSWEKTFLFSSNLLAFTLPLFIINFNPKVIIHSLSICAVVVCLLYLKAYSSATIEISTEQFENISGFYLSGSSFIGLLLVIIVTTDYRQYNTYWSYMLTFFLLTTILFLLGGRGPLLIAVGSLILYYLFNSANTRIRFNKSSLLRFFFMIVLVSSIGLITYLLYEEEVSSLFDRTFSRLSMLTDGLSKDESSNERLMRFSFALEGIFKSTPLFLFGYGIGSYGINYSGIDERSYPHNIFLEIQYELGLVGLLFFLTFLLFVLLRAKKKSELFNLYVLLYLLLDVSKSSSFIDMRVMFVFFGLAFFTSHYVKNRKLV